MKKIPFILSFKSNFFKEQDPFHLVLVFFIIFFGTAIFFSVPTFYDYKKYNQKIENTINNEFKIKLHNLENISFRFIPSPHLLIKKGDLKIGENEKNIISKLENIKVFISITDLYDEKFKIKKIIVNKANFYLNSLSLKNFILNLKKNIVNNFIIKKSTLFFKNKNDEIILISTIKNFDYKIDFVNSKKILKIDGNIFDSNYQFKYLIDYKKFNIQNIYFELKDPNLIIENNLIDNMKTSELIQNGNLKFQFLNQINNFDYEVQNNQIKFKNKNFKNSILDLNGSINFDPFYFNLTVDLKDTSLSKLENLLYFLYKNRKLKSENLSGLIKLNLNSIDNKVLKKGELNLLFEGADLKTEKEKFYLNDFAILEISEYEYLENNNQLLQIKIKIEILNNEKFNRFLYNYKKDKILSKQIYFTYQFNADTGNNFISKVSTKGFGNYSEFYKFNNLQQLKNLLKDDNIFIQE